MRIQNVMFALTAMIFSLTAAAHAAPIKIEYLDLDFKVTGHGGESLTKLGFFSQPNCANPCLDADRRNPFNNVIFSYSVGTERDGKDLGSGIIDLSEYGEFSGFLDDVESLRLPDTFFVTMFLVGGSIDPVWPLKLSGRTNAFGYGGRGEFGGIDALPYAPNPSEVPLPAALPLFMAGLAGLGIAKRRKKAAA